MLQLILMTVRKPQARFLLLLTLFVLPSLSFSQGKIVISGSSKMNMSNGVFVVTKDVSLAGTASLSVNASTIKIAGSISSSNNIDVQTGTVEMNGSSAQTIPANSFTANKILNLIIDNDVTLAGEDSLTGVLSFGDVNSKTFSTGGYLTLKSTAAATASVADLTNNDVNSGNQVLGEVSVERYLSAIKKWRFLSVPTTTTQTIKAAWQEGCGTNANCLVNYGTQITGVAGTAAGFDAYSPAPSMKTYNTVTNGYDGVPTTNATSINSTSNNTVAYMVFVRGDRTATGISSPITQTVLRTKGVIKQGDQPAVTIASPATAYTAVGNPYPSRIDLRKMTPAPTTATKIYVWDPLATINSAYGFGAYHTLTFDGSDFSVTPSGGSYPAQDPNYIESGQAFFVGGNSSPYDITFKEDIKPSVNNLISTPSRLKQNIKADLYSAANGATAVLDGAKADIDINFSAAIDDNDAFKLLNTTENVSFKRNGKLLSVERYKPVAANDTFYLNINNLRVQAYRWQLDLNNLSQPGLTASLEDKYQQTRTALSMNGTTTVDFSVVNIPGSYAADRFYIVFAQASALPLTYTNVKAYRQDKNVNIEWEVVNEINLKQYEVEKSTDGNNFTKVKTTTAKNLSLSSYSWTDNDATAGYQYYRIKSIDVSGRIEYSKIVKVFIGSERQAITVYPNPVKNGVIHLQMLNQPSGRYQIKLFNETGAVFLLATIEHLNNSDLEKINYNKNVAPGIYTLQVITPAGEIVSMKLIHQ